MQKFLNLTNTLWESANNLRTNSSLSLKQFSEPVLWLIFLKFADLKFEKTKQELEKQQAENQAKFGRARPIRKQDYIARWVIYLPEDTRFEYILNQPESSDIWKLLNQAMKEIEENNIELKWILPKSYTALSNDILIELLKTFNSIPDDIDGDVFGMIYEYFLWKFAIKEWQWWWEFFTPTSMVKLIVNIIEPFNGRIFDPACGSGGMFVQSAEFIKNNNKNISNVALYWQEKTADTIKIAKMNLALHGLSWDIKEWLTHQIDHHDSLWKFDFVMANPPFNMSNIDREKLKWDNRYSYWIPSNDNGNYLWIQIFANSLNETWRAGFVMANSASDARNSEAEIRKNMIEDNIVDVMVSVGSNMFFNVTLPSTLWFLDKWKKQTDRKDKILFLDIRNIYRQIDRAHRDLTDEQIAYITDIVKLYRQEEVDFPDYITNQIKQIQDNIKELWDTKAEKEQKTLEQERLKIAQDLQNQWQENFQNGYEDIKWLCKIADLDEVKEQWYSLNAGRYVWVKETEQEDYVFEEKLEELNEDFKNLTEQAHQLEDGIRKNIDLLLNKK